MHIKKNSKSTLRVTISLLLIFCMILSSFTGMVFGDEQGEDVQKETVAVFTNTSVYTQAPSQLKDLEGVAAQTASLTSSAIKVESVPEENNKPKMAFPQHSNYTEETIKPNHITQTEMDAAVVKLYDEWKAKYLKVNPYNSDQNYVWYADGDWFEEDEITVSEAHGYGMLLTALMAGHDVAAKANFDGMYRYFRAHPSLNNVDLMAWQQADRDGKIIDINGVDSATDGDMDIAYGLLLAHKQWGSDGEIDYLAEAKKVIAAIMTNDVNKDKWTLRLGDWATDEKVGTATRPSDFMLQQMKAFAAVSGDSQWNKVINKTYEIIQGLYKDYSPNTGLLPDFVVMNKDGKYVPAEPQFLESDTDGDYSYNSCRTPWRIGADYLLTGDTRAKAQLDKLNEWVSLKTEGKPEKIVAGYKLDGTEIEDYMDISFSAPLMVSAMINSDNQQWLNDLWDYNMKAKTEEELYFGNCLRLLSTIIVSGNWWSPVIGSTPEQKVELMIAALSVNSLVDREDVVLARRYFSNLTNEQKLLVTNIDLLEKAEAQVLKLWIDSAEITSPVDEGLLYVMTEQYEGMNATQKTYVTNAGKLKELGEKFETLKSTKEENYKKAKEVQRIIENIQILKLSDKPAAEEARKVYDALSNDQKAVVTNYGLLKEAENKLASWEGKSLPNKAPDNIIYAGTRSSEYGVSGKWLGTDDWKNIANQMDGYFPGAQPTFVWIIGHLSDEVGIGGCELEFEKPNDDVDYSAKNISFKPSTKADHLSHEEYLDYFDEHGIKVFLQVESGFADMKTLMDLIFAKYGHHTSVIGFGVDVEWYYGMDEDSGLPVTDALAENWDKHLKSINPSYRMFLKHYSIRWLPSTYRSNILFCNDSQSIGSIDGEVPGMYDDTMGFIPEFKAFADFFYPNEVLYQIGYRADAMWYYTLDKPVIKNLGERLAEVTRQNCGITWVDFTIKDPLTFPSLFKTDNEATSAVNSLLGYLRNSGNNMVGKRFAANGATLTDAMYVSRVREVVNALTEVQRGLLKEDYFASLVNLEPKALDIRISKIDLPSLKLKDKAKIASIRDTYTALTAEQQTQVTKLSLLESAEKTFVEYTPGSNMGSSNNTPATQVAENIVPVLDKATGIATAKVSTAYLDNAFTKEKENNAGIKIIEVNVPKFEGATSYALTLPVNYLASTNANKQIVLSTEFASVKLTNNMLLGNADAAGKETSIIVGQGNKLTLADEIKQALGDRPLLQLTMNVNGKVMAWRNEDSPVTVTMPYTPTASELKDFQHIVVWYIDGTGNVVSVPNGHYKPELGTVSFTTNHFSNFAIAYVHKSFNDLDSVGWAKKQIEVLAAKGIIIGTSKDTFSPKNYITRAEFVALLVKTLELTVDVKTNFDDIKEGEIHSKEIGIARALGITAGIGDNKFSPNAPITKQDMVVITASALEKYRNIKIVDSSRVLAKFSDNRDVARYATNSLETLVKEGLISGTENNKIKPRSPATRAEVAAFIYKIYNKYLI